MRLAEDLCSAFPLDPVLFSNGSTVFQLQKRTKLLVPPEMGAIQIDMEISRHFRQSLSTRRPFLVARNSRYVTSPQLMRLAEMPVNQKTQAEGAGDRSKSGALAKIHGNPKRRVVTKAGPTSPEPDSNIIAYALKNRMAIKYKVEKTMTHLLTDVMWDHQHCPNSSSAVRQAGTSMPLGSRHPSE